MKKMWVMVGAISMITGTQAYAAPDVSKQTKIAVVNVQQLFQQSPKIADLNKQLQNKFKPRQDKLIAAQKSLQEELDKFKKESATMSEKDRTAMQNKISDDQSELSKDAATFQEDLRKEQNKIMKNVLAQLNEIISSIAKKENDGLVLDSQAVIFAGEGYDITKEVSKEFDSK
ncbi:MAG: skp [Gammaproteobacteria bacterium]|jgi:outer membrane protein|nr:skp [Gammaproteobacteria bacterium]